MLSPLILTYLISDNVLLDLKLLGSEFDANSVNASPRCVSWGGVTKFALSGSDFFNHIGGRFRDEAWMLFYVAVVRLSVV